VPRCYRERVILDHPIISERYFFPRADAIDQPFVVNCDGAKLACYLARQPGAKKTFVHFHGNGEVVADYLPDYTGVVAAMNVNVCMVEYRGYGGSTGTPELARMLDDVDRVFAALGVAESDLFVYGRSVGSLYAVELAHRHPGIAGLILESSIADLHERLLLRVSPEELGVTGDELAAEVASHFDHRAKLGAYKNPLLVMHARDDELVDWSHAQRHHDWAGSAKKELVYFDYGGHNALMGANWPRYVSTLEEFVVRLSGGYPKPGEEPEVW
jgi:pimeloyl-ACP methyl ester carboxylesterase